MAGYIDKIKEYAAQDIDSTELQKALTVIETKKIAVFIVAYNAEHHIESVIERIPPEFGKLFAEIFIIDDSSSDKTYETSVRLKNKFSDYKINVYRTPYNRGYGGNQKLGYLYCIKKKYDYAVLLHGDGQYAPEYLPKIIAAFDSDTDAVFASRMLNKKRALAGGMPLYKWLGNQTLTYIENKLLNMKLSEFHTGFRAYKISSLEASPFKYNSNDFHFDTEIIIQAKASAWKIVEVSLPAYYGDEKCRVNGTKYALNCIIAVVRYHLVNIGLYYRRNFDIGLFEDERFNLKNSPYSLHRYILSETSATGVSIEIGSNKTRGALSRKIAETTANHFASDSIKTSNTGKSQFLEIDINGKFSETTGEKKFDVCYSFDIIEHLDDPEKFIKQIFRLLKTGGKLYISTANIGYLPMRISLLIGQFNYSRRGILDMTHKRLFTLKTFKDIILQHGFKIEKIEGFPPPLTDFISKNILMRLIEKIHHWLANLWPGLFAYNMLFVCRSIDGLDDIFELTINRLDRN